LARGLAERMGALYIELDQIHHQPGWQEIEPARFAAIVDDLTAVEAWVVDGNYRAVVSQGIVWRRADTVVWLDIRRRTAMRQVIWRTIRRGVTRQELWNGNRELLRDVLAWDPARSIIRSTWISHAKYASRYEAAMADPRLAHLCFIRLRSHHEASAWLASTAPGRDGSPAAGSGTAGPQ
jgi:glycerol kinase